MLIPVIAGTFVLILLLWLTATHSLLVPPKKGLPILMYHKVAETRADGLTIPAERLAEQFRYIRDKGYQTIFFRELALLVKTGQPLPAKTLIITFDDAYGSFYTDALPLLEKYNLKATVFVPLAYMGKKNAWDHGNDPIMSAEVLKEIQKGTLVEIGLHSFVHRNYKDMMVEDMREDLLNCTATLTDCNLTFVRVLAYPYGGYPKKDNIRLEKMKELFRELNLDFALRIGNRINPIPLKDPYELQRIDIKGTDSFFTFRIKLRKGRKKLFS